MDGLRREVTEASMRLVILNNKEYIEYDLECPECGSNMELRKSRYGIFYGCQEFETEGCKGHISADKEGTPSELPIDQQTKKSQILARENFERLWKYGKMTRQESFSWACFKMKRQRNEFNISTFSIMECDKLIKLINKRLRNVKYY